MLDTHLCFISPFVLPDRTLQSTLEPRSRSTPEVTTTTSSSPQTRSSFGGSQAGGFAFLICISDVVCASLLKAKLDSLCLYSDIMVFITLYSGPCDPLIL